MESMSEFISELEGYQDLEASIIRKTKIHKVLKNIIKIASIPLEEKFKFKDRSRDLLAKWNEILTNDPAGGAGEGADDKGDENGKAEDTSSKVAEPSTSDAPDAPVANGSATAEEKKTGVETTTADDEITKPAADANDENKIGSTIEGEKQADEPAEGTKAAEKEQTAAEKQTDGPAMESAPEAEYKPPVDTAEATADSVA